MSERIRRGSRWIAASWLVGQLAMAVLTVAVLAAIPTRTILPGHCECPGSPETQTCPMHGDHHGSGPAETGLCAMRQGATPPATVITMLPGFSVPAPVVISRVSAAASPLLPVTGLPRDRAVRPEAPPPRA